MEKTKGGWADMIAFDFEYFKPQTIQEAAQLSESLKQQRRQPAYYSGGTEILTLGRISQWYADAVIDLKEIPECNVLKTEQSIITIGSCITLDQLKQANVYPMLSKTIGEIADHTARQKITIGGNLCGQIMYREGVLPLLLADCNLVIAGPKGSRTVSIHEIFREQLQLQSSEFLLQIQIDSQFVGLPYRSVKKRKQGNVGYPLVTLTAIKKENQTRIAISGVCSYPFLFNQAIDHGDGQSIEEKISQIESAIPEPVLDDIEGSADYRLYVLRNTLRDVLNSLEGVEYV